MTPPKRGKDTPVGRAGAIAVITAEQAIDRNADRRNHKVFRLVRFYKAFKRARQFGFTLFDAYLAARANSH